MISRIVGTLQLRFQSEGYNSIITPITVEVSSPQVVRVLSNDIYVLTGILVSDADAVGEATRISLVSPTSAIEGSARDISLLGSSANQIFKNNLIIKTTDAEGNYDEDATIMPYKLYFMKVSPYKKKQN